MYVKSKHHDGYIKKAKILLGQFCDQSEADVFVTLREMTMAQKLSFNSVVKSGDSEGIWKTFAGMLPDLVVDHNFYEDEAKPMDRQAVVATIMEREDVALYMLEEYKVRVMGLPSGEKTPAKSDQSPTTTSGDGASTKS
jgi:hypothetical protein